MKATLNAVPLVALELGSSRRWLEALTVWFRESSRREAALFDEASTDVFHRAARARAAVLRDALK